MSFLGYSILAPSLFVATSFCTVSRQVYLKKYFCHSRAIYSDIDDVKTPPNKVIVENPIVRNDSEYSLGLNRSESFENLVTSIGPLCSSGKMIWMLLQFSLKGLTVIAIGRILVSLSIESNNSDFELKIKQYL